MFPWSTYSWTSTSSHLLVSCWAACFRAMNSVTARTVRIRCCHNCVFLTFSLRPVIAFGGLLQTFREKNSPYLFRFMSQTCCANVTRYATFWKLYAGINESIWASEKTGLIIEVKLSKGQRVITLFLKIPMLKKQKNLDSFNCLFRFLPVVLYTHQEKKVRMVRKVIKNSYPCVLDHELKLFVLPRQ